MKKLQCIFRRGAKLGRNFDVKPQNQKEQPTLSDIFESLVSHDCLGRERQNLDQAQLDLNSGIKKTLIRRD